MVQSRCARRTRRAFTLLEMILALAVTTVLMGALTLAVALAGRSIPAPDNPITTALAAAHAAEQISGELFTARSFPERSEKLIEFTVSDRNNDGVDETLRYEWSGAPGDPLMRTYNGGEPAVFLNNVHDFALAYDIETRSETTTEESDPWGEETLLAYFDGWEGITVPDKDNKPVNSINWGSQYFEVGATIPEGATALRVTRVQLRLSQGSDLLGAFSVAIHPAQTDGSFLPDLNTLVGSPASVSTPTLSTSPRWEDIALPDDVIIDDLSQTQFCLVLRSDGGLAAWYEFYNARSAPDNGTVLRWTTDGGSSWDPRTSQIHQNDMRFYAYGAYATNEEQTTTVEKYFLKGIRLRMQGGPQSTAALETSVAVLNTPEVSTP